MDECVVPLGQEEDPENRNSSEIQADERPIRLIPGCVFLFLRVRVLVAYPDPE